VHRLGLGGLVWGRCEFESQLEPRGDSSAVVLVEVREIFRQQDREAFLAKSILKEVGPDVGELSEVDVSAGP